MVLFVEYVHSTIGYHDHRGVQHCVCCTGASGVFLSGNLPNTPTVIGDISIENDEGSNTVEPIPWVFFNDTNDGINIVDTTLSILPDDQTMAIEYPKY